LQQACSYSLETFYQWSLTTFIFTQEPEQAANLLQEFGLQEGTANFIPDKEQLVDASFFIMLTLPTTIKDLSTSMKKALYDSIVHVEEEDSIPWLWNLTMAKQGKRKTLVT